MRFFTEAETWPEVPQEIDTPVLESAMAVLTDFQTNAARNDLYRSRLDSHISLIPPPNPSDFFSSEFLRLENPFFDGV
jgi:hypothetical protein